MEQTAESGDTVHRVKRGRPAKVAAVETPTGGQIVMRANAAAQSLALRIWSGQSPDVPVKERVERVVRGLKEQGLSLDIELPHDDASKYLGVLSAG